MQKRNTGSNLPLYGACAGIAALLFGTWIAHQLKPDDGQQFRYRAPAATATATPD